MSTDFWIGNLVGFSSVLAGCLFAMYVAYRARQQ